VALCCFEAAERHSAVVTGCSISTLSFKAAPGVGVDIVMESISLIIGEDTMIEDLYDLIGGHSTIEAATELFYNKILRDDSLRHFFDRVDMAHLRSRQAMLISMLLGGRVYTGKNIRDAHARSRDQGLNDAHFDLFLQYFRAALEEVGVEPENAEKVMKRLESTRGTVLDT
jgi:hemoglobin